MLAPESKLSEAEKVFQLDQTPSIQGAFAILNPLNGSVIAAIGGFEFSERNSFNRSTQALRQPGSSFKPYIYFAAMERLGYTPSTLVPDSPISLRAGNGLMWSPKNYDRKFLGPITMRVALQRSRNVVSVFMATKLGLQNVKKSAERFGLAMPEKVDYSISLGTAEVHLIDQVSAYGTFAAGGYRAVPRWISSIVDRDGKVIYESKLRVHKVMSEDHAFIMANMMKGVIERGTAQSLKPLGHPIAGKTGTTNNQMDVWFIGYTPEWSAGVWVGFDEKKNIGQGETGGRAAAPIFLYFMQEFLKDKDPVDFEIPNGVVPVVVDANSGRQVKSEAANTIWEYYLLGTEPLPYEEDVATQEEYLVSDEF